MAPFQFYTKNKINKEKNNTIFHALLANEKKKTKAVTPLPLPLFAGKVEAPLDFIA